MPFSAILNEEKIYSFKFTEDEWSILKANKNENILMPCCNSEVVLKTSKLGTRYFSHKPKVNCGYSSPETVEHLFCKYIVAKTLYKLGWTVETEKEGVTPSGKKWIADIYAEKNNQKMCIEIQWSSQSVEDTELRHKIYEESGIRCLWLMRFPKSAYKNDSYMNNLLSEFNQVANVLFLKKNSEDEFHIGGFVEYFGDVTGQITTKIQSLEIAQALKEMFLEKKISKIKFDKLDKYLRVNFHQTSCWKCKSDTSYVFGFDFLMLINDKFIDLLQISLTELNEVEDEDYAEYGLGIEVHEVDTILKCVNKESFVCNFGPIKKRFSNTVGYSYISNGCVSCGALQGSFYYHEIMNDPSFCSKPVKIEGSFGFLKSDFNPWIVK